MKQWAMLGLMGLSLLASGCQLAWDITSNLTFETCLFSDQVSSTMYYYHLAGDAWRQFYLAHPEKANDRDFGKGFRRGYTEYLEDGGIPGTPAMPPQRYWKCRYQSPQGRAATNSWYAGYKEGAWLPKASGYRPLIVVPAGKCEPPHPPGVPVMGGAVPIVPGAAVPTPGQSMPSSPEIELPAPGPRRT